MNYANFLRAILYFWGISLCVFVVFHFVFLLYFGLYFWGKLSKLKFRLQKEFDFICIRLNKLSYHTKNEAYSS